jgi:hypothetical protein
MSVVNKFKNTTIYGTFQNKDRLTSATDATIVEQANAIIDRNLLVSGNITTPLLLIGTPASSVPLLVYIATQISGTTNWGLLQTFSTGIALTPSSLIHANNTTISDVALSYISTLSSDIQTQVNSKSATNSPTFTGVPLSTTGIAGDTSQQIATNAFVSNAIGSISSVSSASPSFTGIPTCPTASAGTSTIQLSSTAFVQNAITNLISASTAYTGTNTFNSFLPSSTITASTTYQLTNKFYVDSIVGSIFTTGHNYTKLNTFNSVLPTSTISASTANQFTNKTYVDTAITNSFIGTPSVPTALAGTNTTQISTTAYVVTGIANAISALGMGTYAKTSSPTFTGVPLSVSPNVGDNTTQIATSYFTNIAISNAINTAISGLGMGNYALSNNPTFTGTPIAPTPVAGTNTTQISTTAYVVTGIANAVTALSMGTYAKLASPMLTGTPTCPTAVSTINNTQIASTAFVKTASTALLSLVNIWSGASNTFNNDIYVNGIQMGQGNTTNINLPGS